MNSLRVRERNQILPPEKTKVWVPLLPTTDINRYYSLKTHRQGQQRRRSGSAGDTFLPAQRKQHQKQQHQHPQNHHRQRERIWTQLRTGTSSLSATHTQSRTSVQSYTPSLLTNPRRIDSSGRGASVSMPSTKTFGSTIMLCSTKPKPNSKRKVHTCGNRSDAPLASIEVHGWSYSGAKTY